MTKNFTLNAIRAHSFAAWMYKLFARNVDGENPCQSLFLAFILFVPTLSIPLYAQNHTSNQKFIHYSTRMGLSSSMQNCLVQDNEGFLWVGTNDGLNRFDGSSFKIYRKIPHDSTSLQSPTIVSLFVDSEGTLWVGTQGGGLARYNKELDNFTTYRVSENPSSLSNNVVSSIMEDRQHRLWIGTFRGLNLFDKRHNRFVQYHIEPDRPSRSIAFEQIKSLTLDGDQLWISYYAETISVVNTRSKVFTHYKLFDISDRNIKEFMVTSICPDSNILWVSTWGKGVWLFDRKTATCQPFTKIASPLTNFVQKDNKNQLWIGTESDGLLMLNRQRTKLTHYQHDDFDKYSLSNNSPSACLQDQQGNFWLGSKKGNLHYLITDNPFHIWRRNPTSPTALANNNVSCVLEDRRRRLWVGYVDGGIEIFDLNGHQRKTSIAGNSTTGLGEGTVVTLHESRNGTIWVGTYLDGLKKYEEKTGKFTSYRHNPTDSTTLACNSIRQIAEDSRGNLWLATHGSGLDKLDLNSGKFLHHRVDYANTDHTISSDWLMSVLCDEEDNIWVGSVSGVSVINTKTNRITHFKNDPANDQSLSNDHVNTLFRDSRGNVWIGTMDGLNQLDPKTHAIRVYSLKDGLPSSAIMGILEDSHQKLWVSTGRGLSNFSPQKGSIKTYSIEDGLETDEFLTGSCFKNAQGEMYFGGREGLNRFHPDSFPSHSFLPPVYITDLKLFNQSVPVGRESAGQPFALSKQIRLSDEITLDYDQNMIGFDFVALDYLNLGKIQFAYKMQPFDKNWVQSGHKREATYTNLHPGTYVFTVKSTNSDGVWNEKGTSVKIIVKPPFWKTNWALALYVVLFILLLYLFWLLGSRHDQMLRKLALEKLEVEKLQEMDAQKMRFFSNISHELRTPLTLIVGPLEHLIRTIKDDLQQIQVRTIYRNTQHLLRLINQLMDFRRLETEGLKSDVSLSNIVRFIQMVASSFILEAKHRNIDFNVITQEDLVIAWFDADKLEKILFNLIGNAFKFTPENGKVTIQIAVETQAQHDRQAIRIIVEDSGIGIPAESLSKIFDRFYQVDQSLNNHGTGIGLALTKELIQLQNGEIKVESAMGLGSRFTVILPLQTDQPATDLAAQNSPKEPLSEEEEELLNYASDHSNFGEHIHEENLDKKPLLLLIEDNFDMRLFIKNELGDSYRIIETSDGLRGFEKAVSEVPDGIISDVMMPGMDGVSLCKKLKTDVRTSHIPVVLLTARNAEEHILTGLESGADDYVVKPFSTCILKVRIKNLIESRRLLRKRFLKEPEATIPEISPSLVDEKFLKKAYEIVEQHLGNPNFEATDFAVAIGMSRAQLYRKISAISGQSVKEFVRIIRLKKAAEMLVHTEHNVSEVAFEVGFNSIAYFTKSFSGYFGMPPSKYVSEHRPSCKKNSNA